jgi:hypothetical protein
VLAEQGDREHGTHGTQALPVIGEVVWELAAGAAIGVAVGALGMLFLRKVALPATGLYPVAVLALIVVGYGAADLAKASGFLAVYAAAVLLGNVRLPHGPATRGFAEGVGWLAQIGLFVMLGLLASPSRLPGQILPALAVGVILALIARPVAVLATTLPFRLPLRQQAFLSWAGLRGAVPIVLTTIPLSAHGGQRDRRGGGLPGVCPVGGEAALRQDQHERAEPERLGQVRVVEPDAKAALAERQPESEEDEEGGQAGAVRQPGRHDGREHRGRADQQVESEGARCHTFSIRAGRGVPVQAHAPGRPPGDRRCQC